MTDDRALLMKFCEYMHGMIDNAVWKDNVDRFLAARQPQGEPRGAAYLSTLPACRQCGRVGVTLYQDLCCHCDGREVGR